MKAFNRLSLYTALAGIGALGVSAAQAVNVSPDGRGQVLIYPYYTTRSDGAGNAYATLLSVVNPTALAKAVKVRFLEGRNGRSVLDFSLFLSPFDVWTAAILPDTELGGAKVGTVDLSCTMPAFSASPISPFIRFGNSAYTGVSDDGAGSSLDRTKEGYFEIIEMASYNSASITGTAVTHVNGVPPCGSGLNDAQAAMDALPVTGGLFGAATLINVNAGTDYSVEATALANFYQIGANFYPSGSPLPDLNLASPPLSMVNAPNGTMYQSLWVQGSADPVSAVLMHDSVMNEFTLDTSTKSGTDWVVTMPTKRFYVSNGTGTPAQLFQRNFGPSAGSCDDVTLSIWDREGRKLQGPLNFSPPPPTPTSSLCWTANVITFNNTNVLGSLNAANLQTAPFQNGWLTLGFPTGATGMPPSAHRLINNGKTSITVSGGTTTENNFAAYNGLPAIGFAVISFSNGTLVVGSPPTTVLSNYGGDFRHKNNTTIQ